MAVLCNYMRFGHEPRIALPPNWESVCTNLVFSISKAPSYPRLTAIASELRVVLLYDDRLTYRLQQHRQK